MHHCSIVDGTCHTHQIEQYTGIASGTFVAPDHEYPSHLEIKLIGHRSFGATRPRQRARSIPRRWT